MVKRLYLKELLGFKEVELEFDSNLIVISGPSGAGKSVLMGAMLSLFGHKSSAQATVAEMLVAKPKGLESQEVILDEDEIIIRQLKKEKVRTFINGQQLSKKALFGFFKDHVKFLSVRNKGGFESETLLGLIDQVALKSKTFRKLYKEYQKRFMHYSEQRKKHEKLSGNNEELLQKVEFLRYEIEQIESVAPKVGEFENLLEQKKTLSKIDKLREAANEVQGIFEYEGAIERFYALLDEQSGIVDEALNKIRIDLDLVNEKADSLEELDVEALLDRIEMLSSLQRRYGSIESALEALEVKRQELKELEFSDATLEQLTFFLENESRELYALAQKISKEREAIATTLSKSMRGYLAQLKLPDATFRFTTQTLGKSGIDLLALELDEKRVDLLSGGEYNRLRLALLAAFAKEGAGAGGVLFFDEIDANVSGEESIAIAKMLKDLSKRYQIFAISHQPHLCAISDEHVVVKKSEGQSVAALLDHAQRRHEIARILSGDRAQEKSLALAEELLLTYQGERA